MSSNQPTSAQILARMISGGMRISGSYASVQRSHRFPLHIFACLENMAEMAGVPVSVIINQTLESGLETVLKELPEETRNTLMRVSETQLNRPLKNT